MAKPIPSVRRESEFRAGGFNYVMELDDGKIILRMDSTTEDSHIDARWPYKASVMELALDRAAWWGYTPIPEDESPATITDNGMVRIYLEYVSSD
jgi:hypothetical protein